MNSCKRSWEVEAARDGRLSGADQTSLARHLASCSVCSTEAQRLAQLAAELRALPVHEPDQLARRRARQELLARAHAQPSSPPRARLRPALALGSVALALCGWGGVYWAKQLATPEALVVQPSAGAHYTHLAEARRELVQLREGTLSLRIASGPRHKAVVVQTPDGEIEDIGTVFAVSVQRERTSWISVSEGRVVARIGAGQPRSIAAGEIFRPYAQTAPVARRAQAPSAEPAPPSVPVREVGVSPMAVREASNAHTGRRTHASGHVVHDSATSSPGSPASHLFAQAAEHVERHEDPCAAALLAAFLAQYPEDHRGEDARFLRLVVLRRLGDLRAAETAAHVYLARHPQGFRAPEVRAWLERDAALAP